MMISIWQLDALFALFIVWQLVRDRFAWLNEMADAFERRFLNPIGLGYAKWGDAATWVHHGLISVVVAIGWGVLGAAVSEGFLVGFFHGAFAMASFYTIREGLGLVDQFVNGSDRGVFVDKRNHGGGIHVGFLIDGLLDLVGPYANLLVAAHLVGVV